MRDRYLFSADRKASEYKHVLEITPGRARLLTPNGSAWGWRWVGSLALLVTFLAFFAPAGLAIVGTAAAQSPVVAWILIIAATAAWLGGLFLAFFLWDRKSLLFLADAPSHSLDLILLGARSFGTFQDVRARVPGGEELHLVVDARAPRFWEAVRLLRENRVASG